MTKYKLIFSIKAYAKLRLYIENTRGEISGLGKVSKIENPDAFYVEDVFLLDQQSDAGGTTLNKNGLTKFLDDLLAKGESPSDYKCWWHSHNDFECFWSGIDIETIEDFSTEQLTDNWWLSIVSNKQGDIVCRVDIFEPVRVALKISEWEIDFEDPKLKEEVEEEIKEKVKPWFFTKLKIKKEEPISEEEEKNLENLFPDD